MTDAEAERWVLVAAVGLITVIAWFVDQWRNGGKLR